MHIYTPGLFANYIINDVFSSTNTYRKDISIIKLKVKKLVIVRTLKSP